MNYALLLVAALLGACTSSSGHFVPSPIASERGVTSISEVFIEIKSTTLPRDRQSVFRSVSGVGKLRTAIVQALRKDDLLDESSPVTLWVEVLEFRLRSTGTSFWVGTMAGEDNLAVRAVARIDGDPIERYEASASSVRGGILFPGASGRFTNLARRIAREISEQLSHGR